jgi:hypothetical protein
MRERAPLDWAVAQNNLGNALERLGEGELGTARLEAAVFREALQVLRGDAGKLSVRGKSGRRSELPLPAEVGKAIAAYLRRGRPKATSRRVFLRAKDNGRVRVRSSKGPRQINPNYPGGT